MKGFSFLILFLVIFDQTESWWRRRRRCPVQHCAVSVWSPWQTCSHPCGPNGISKRTRKITADPHCGGAGCPLLEQQKPCNRDCGQGALRHGSCRCNAGWKGVCCHQGKHL